MSEPIGALDATQVPRFAGLGTFARIPDIGSVPDYDVAMLGVPFDGGTSYRPGRPVRPDGHPPGLPPPAPEFHVELDTSPFEQVAGRRCRRRPVHAVLHRRGGDPDRGPSPVTSWARAIAG